jgi:hypothetical protein
MCPGVDSASKNEYQVNPGGKGGLCLRLTTYHLHVPMSRNLLGASGPVQACNGTALSFIVIVELKVKVTELNISYNYAISSTAFFFVDVIVNFFVITKYSNCHISNDLSAGFILKPFLRSGNKA